MRNQNKSCTNCDAKTKCFKRLLPLELELTDAHRVELKYRKGENIAKQGSFATHILFLQKGLVKIYLETDEGNDLIVNLFNESTLIGLPNLFTNAPLQYSVAAVEDSVLCAVDKKVIEELIKNNGAFAQAIIESINRCTYYHYRRIVAASKKHLNGRMAEALLHLSDNIYHSEDFNLPLSRKELSELAGMSMMSAVRVIKDMEHNGIISENNGHLLISNRKKLEEISKYG